MPNRLRPLPEAQGNETCGFSGVGGSKHGGGAPKNRLVV